MIIEITRNTRAQGQDLSIGEVVDVPDQDARALIAYGKAVTYTPKAEVPKVADPNATNTTKA